MLAIELNCNELELAMPAIGNAMAGGNLLPSSLTATLGPEAPQIVQVEEVKTTINAAALIAALPYIPMSR